MVHLLVVDDEKNLLEGLCMVLEALDYTVHSALSGQEAVDILHELNDDLPDLILADITMYGMTGIQLKETVRTYPNYEHIPFLFISALPIEIVQAQIAGGENTAFLHKPFEIDELATIIVQILAP